MSDHSLHGSFMWSEGLLSLLLYPAWCMLCDLGVGPLWLLMLSIMLHD